MKKNIKSFLIMLVIWIIAIIFCIFMTSCESRSANAAEQGLHPTTYVVTIAATFTTGETDTVNVYTEVHPSITMNMLVEDITFQRSKHECVVIPGRPNITVCDVYLFQVLSIELLDTTQH